MSVVLKISSMETFKNNENNNPIRTNNNIREEEKDLLFAKTLLNIYISEFNIKLRKIDYSSILKLIKNNFSVDDDNDKYLFDKNYNKADATNNDSNNNDNKEKPENEKKIKINHENKNINNPQPKIRLEFSLLVNIEVIHFQVIDDLKNYLELFLIETNFTMQNYTNKDLINFTAQNIHMKDNQISIISNKKGIENSQNLKNYCQLNVNYVKEKGLLAAAADGSNSYTNSQNTINIVNTIDVSLIDLKIFVKLDLIKFITEFLRVEEEEANSTTSFNINEKSNRNKPILITKNKIDYSQGKEISGSGVAVSAEQHENSADLDHISLLSNKSSVNNNENAFDAAFEEEKQLKPNKKTNINISISNNIFFLRSEDNFNTQQILALEGDLVLDLSLSEEILSRYFICNKEYEIDQNIFLECSLQNFAFSSAFVDSFESDFEKLYNKKLLIEPANFFIDFRNKKIKDLEALTEFENGNFMNNEIGLFEKKQNE